MLSNELQLILGTYYIPVLSRENDNIHHLEATGGHSEANPILQQFEAPITLLFSTTKTDKLAQDDTQTCYRWLVGGKGTIIFLGELTTFFEPPSSSDWDRASSASSNSSRSSKYDRARLRVNTLKKR